MKTLEKQNSHLTAKINMVKGCICRMMLLLAFHRHYSWHLSVQGAKVLITFMCGKIYSPINCTLLTIPSRGPHRNKQSFHLILWFQTAPGYWWPTLCKIIFEWIHCSPGVCVPLELKIPSCCISQHLICCF